jgi:hypothetical protein
MGLFSYAKKKTKSAFKSGAKIAGHIVDPVVEAPSKLFSNKKSLSKASSLKSARESRSALGKALTGEMGAGAILGEANELSLGNIGEGEGSELQEQWKKLRGTGEYKGKSSSQLKKLDSGARSLLGQLQSRSNAALGKGMDANKARESLLARRKYLNEKQAQPGRLQTLISKTM